MADRVKRLSLLLAVVLLTSCAGEEPEASPTPSSLPTATAELGAEFEKLSGLRLPENATDLQVDAELLEGERPYYQVRFETTRGGAEVICTADNFDFYPSDEPPSAKQREEFPVEEEDSEIAETVECVGSHPTDGRVQRGALVLFPEDGARAGDGGPDGEDVAVVYAYASEMPAGAP